MQMLTTPHPPNIDANADDPPYETLGQLGQDEPASGCRWSHCSISRKSILQCMIRAHTHPQNRDANSDDLPPPKQRCKRGTPSYMAPELFRPDGPSHQRQLLKSKQSLLSESGTTLNVSIFFSYYTLYTSWYTSLDDNPSTPSCPCPCP